MLISGFHLFKHLQHISFVFYLPIVYLILDRTNTNFVVNFISFRSGPEGVP